VLNQSNSDHIFRTELCKLNFNIIVSAQMSDEGCLPLLFWSKLFLSVACFPNAFYISHAFGKFRVEIEHNSERNSSSGVLYFVM
jgi:hypothetical protein